MKAKGLVRSKIFRIFTSCGRIEVSFDGEMDTGYCISMISSESEECFTWANALNPFPMSLPQSLCFVCTCQKKCSMFPIK